MSITEVSKFHILHNENIFTSAEIQIHINKLKLFWKELNEFQLDKNRKKMRQVIEN